MSLLQDHYLTAKTRTSLQGAEFRPRNALEGSLGGSRRSTRHGFAVEFAGHREYVPGDDLRHFDWRAFYRSRRRYTKQYQEETNLHLYLLLDMSPSMQYPLKWEDTKQLSAARLALALAYVAVAQRDAVSLVPFPQKTPQIPRPASSMLTLYRMVEQIETLRQQTDQTAAQRPFWQSLGQLAQLTAAGRMGRRGMIIVISDFLDRDDADSSEKLKANLRKLQRSRHELMLFHVLHPDEYDFPTMAKRCRKPKRFLDLEGNKFITANPRQFCDIYTKRLGEYLERIEGICRTLRIKYVSAPSDGEPGSLVRDALRSRRQILGFQHATD